MWRVITIYKVNGIRQAVIHTADWAINAESRDFEAAVAVEKLTPGTDQITVKAGGEILCSENPFLSFSGNA